MFARSTKQASRILSRAMSQTVAGRVAIVTGASKGIGRGIALRLAKDGYDVVLNDLASTQAGLQEVSSEIKEAGVRFLVVPGDVSVEADVKNLVSSAVKDLGGLDVMIANAGICITKSVAQTTVEDWDRLFAVNGRGTFLCYKYAAEQMLKQGRGGRIIGASSIAGKKGFPLLAAYSATKFAIRSLTQSLAQDLGRTGITVNAYAPGAIETEMLSEIGKAQGPVTEALLQGLKETSAVGFAGKPDDIAGLVSYLVRDESRFLTGQTILIDGGTLYD